MKYVIVTAIVCLLSIASFSQIGSIFGDIIDSNNLPVPFASVILLSAEDSVLIDGSLSKENGDFTFNEIKSGTYFLKISFVGMEEYLSPIFELSDAKPSQNFEEISLYPSSTNLESVSIVGQRIKGKDLIDRMVYNIDSTILKTSNSGRDLLQRIPRLTVDAENNLSMQGSTNFEIYVDGMKSNADYVFALPPNQISRIEIIDNPSSKYDSELTGIIQVYTKGNTNKGGMISLNLAIPTGETYRIFNSLGVNIKCKKLSVDFNAGFFMLKGYNYRTIERNNWDTDSLYILQDGKTESRFFNVNPSLTARYAFNSSNSLIFYANKDFRGFNKTQNMTRIEELLSNGIATNSEFETIKKFDWEYSGEAYSLFYEKLFQKPSTSLTVNATYSQWNDKGTDYNKDWVSGDEDNNEVRDFVRKDREKVIEARSDFSTKFMDKVNFEAGCSYSFQNLTDNLIGDVIGFDNSFTLHKDSLIYDEGRSAGYVNFKGAKNDINWMFGLRAEYSSVLINNSIKADYQTILPSLSLQKKLEKNKSLKLSYSKRVRRPRSYHLNPFLKQNEKYTYEQGNPEIQPAYTHRLFLSYTLAKKKNMINPKIFINYYTNNINQIYTVDNESVLTKKWDNGGNSYDLGIDISAQLQPFKWWNIDPYISFSNYHILEFEEKGFHIHEQSDFVWQTSLSTSVSFLKTFNALFNINWSSPDIDAQQKTYSDISYTLYIEKKILNEKGKLGVRFITPFMQESKRETITDVNDEYDHFRQSDTRINYYKYLITLNFSYNLQWGEFKANSRINTQDINSGRGGGF